MPRRHLARFAPRQLALGAAAVALLSACAQHPDAARERALDSDLALATQSQRGAQVVSPQELTGTPPAATAPQNAAPAHEPVHTRVIEREHIVYRSAPATYAASAPVSVAPAPVPSPTYDPYPAPRREGNVDGGYGRGNGTYGTGTYGTARQPVYRPPQGHAQRDGAIGAVAGAMVGVAASHRKDRLRGGLLGAVAGGALGAIYGHSVDRTP